MALQSSGQISLSQIASEFGGSAPHSLSEYYGKRSGIPASGEIQLAADFYGDGVLSGTYLGHSYQASGNTNSSFTVNNGSGTSNDLIVICYGHEQGDNNTHAETFTVNGTSATQAIFSNVSGDVGGQGQSRVGIWYCSPASNGTIAGDTTLTIAKTTSISGTIGFRSAMSVYRVNNGASGSVSAGGSQATTGQNTITATNSSTNNKLIVVASHMAEGGNHSLSTTNGTLTQHDLVNSGANNGDGQSGFITGCTGTNSVTLTRVTGTSSGGRDAIVTAVFY